MAYEKLYNEIYAALSLKFLWKEYSPCFVKSESPDWINETMDLGLEVSQALLPDDGQTKNLIEKYLGCVKDDLPDIMRERYGDRLYFYNDRFWAVLPDPAKTQDYLYKAEYRFRDKLEHLNTNYQHRHHNGLYLYLHPIDESELDISSLYQTMEKEQADREVKFDWVFLNCRSVIYICNYLKGKLETIRLPKNAEDFLNAETERLRHTIAWENGTAV